MNQPTDKPLPLNCDRDVTRWAKEFNEVLVKRGEKPQDEGWLISWFANAMMCGEDTYRWRKEAEAAALSAREPTLTKHAQIGGTIFSPGIKWSTVIGRAEREYEYEQTPERQAERKARLAEFVKNAGGAAVALGGQHTIICYCREEDKPLCRNKGVCVKPIPFSTPDDRASKP